MCRIFGGKYLGDFKFYAPEVDNMRDTMFHGGPDGGSTFNDNIVFLTHRRLSIVDLSSAGNQPFVTNKWVISYNGEIYNYKQIRNELIHLGYTFKSNTDTEVIIYSFDRWGFSCLDKFRGMFAFALYNKETEELILCRDRFGVKPLYWYKDQKIFMFSSEIKPFYKYKYFNEEINISASHDFIKKGYISELQSIYKHVKKLSPGNYLIINKKNEISFNCYWNPCSIFYNSKIISKSIYEQENQLEFLLTNSFSLRTVSDVPIGVFLSGGIDSSLVASILQKKYGNIKTFTVGFEDSKYDESLHAEVIANNLETNHHSIICSKNDFISIIEKLPFIFDEPFADASAIPTYLLSSFTKQYVKVALSGDGGDELFGGYSKYKFINKYRYISKLPSFVKNVLIILLDNITPELFSIFVKKYISKDYTLLDEKYFKFKNIISSNTISEMIENSSSILDEKQLSSISNHKSKIFIDDNQFYCDNRFITSLTLNDFLTFLPSSVLTKVDRSSMQHGLEARDPFLDPEILDFSFSLKDNFKINNGNTKYILKRILSKYLPNDLIDRPKSGFTIPVVKWLNENYPKRMNDMINDYSFCQKFNLNQVEIKNLYYSFKKGKNRINPIFFWHLFCLYNWNNYKHA